MQVLIILLLFIIGCGDGNFNFSETGDNRDNTNIQYGEPNEGRPSPSDGATSPNGNGSGINPECRDVMGLDGAGGFLWKSISESDGNLVLLFPKEFTEKFVKVEVVDLVSGVEQGRFANFANGDRQHWRFKKPGANYTGKVTAYSENGECTWEVLSPSERQD